MTDATAWPPGSSEMARRIRAHDWSTTPLGPSAGWPISLRTIVELMLASVQPVYIAWGDEMISLYNDGYIPIAGTKHPASVGVPYARMWAEVADELRPVIESVRAGEACHFVDQPMALAGRPGCPTSWFTYSWTPVRDDAGKVAGLYCVATETTERVLAERALQQRYRALADAIDEGFCIIEMIFDDAGRPVDYRVLDVNPAFEGQTGLTNAVGKRMRELAADHEEFWYETYGRIALSGTPERFESRAEALGRWYSVYAFRVGNPADRRLAVLFNDVAERKEAEAALRASEAKYRTLFETMGQGYCELELVRDAGGRAVDQRYIEFNPAFERIFGIEVGSARGRLASEVFPGLEQGWTETFAKVAETGEPARIEEMVGALGRWFEVHAYPQQGDRIGVLYSEITKRKQAEIALRESESRLTAAFRSVPAGIAVIDAEGKATMANADYLRFLPGGLIPSRDKVRGHRWEAWDEQGAPIAPNDFPGARALRGETVTPGQEMLYTDDDGRQIWTNFATAPTFDGSGRVTGCVSVISDIDLRKRAEQQLRDSKERQAFLLRLSDSLRAEPDAGAVANRALQMLLEHMRLDRCYITYYHPQDDLAEFPYQVGNDTVPPLPASVRLSDFPDAYDQVRERTFVVEDDFARALTDAERANSTALGMRAMLASTVRRGEKYPLGSLMAVSSTPRRWTPAEIAFIEDAAERIWSAIEHARAEQEVRASEERIRRFGEASQDILWMRDSASLQWTYLTPAFEAIYGISRDEALKGDNYRNWLDLIVPEDREHAAEAIRKVQQGEQVAFQYRVRRPSDGTIRWLRNTDFPIHDAAGRITLIGGVGQDITELRESGERAQLLLAELQHRVRNILAMIRSIVRRSREGYSDLDEFTAHLVGRLDAMARTQVLLTRAAGAKLSLSGLVWDELQAQIADEQRVKVSGPEVTLSPKAAEVLTLALHELATNSVKYGALSDPVGRLVVKWTVVGRDGADWLTLVWEERCRQVPPRPLQPGFGTELIEDRVPYEMKGEASLCLTDKGVRAEIAFPLSDGPSILETGATPGAGI